MTKICIVGDSRTQLSIRALAENMFTSTLFKRSRDYARSQCDVWYIASAHYGLLEPDELIDPYSVTIDSLSDEERFKVTQRIVQGLYRRGVSTNDSFVILTKAAYSNILEPVLAARSYDARYPLAGKGIVQQLWWLEAHTK